MKADELLQITLCNAKSTKEIVEMCENGAKLGYSSYSHFGYLSVEQISELGNMGFRVKEITGPIGEKCFAIYWA